MKTLRETDYFVAWLLFFAVATVVGGLFGGVFGFVVGSVFSALGIEMSTAITVMKAWVYLLAVPISYLCFRLVVGRMIVRKMRLGDSAPALADAASAGEIPSAEPVLSPTFSAEKDEPRLRHSGLGALSLVLSTVAIVAYAACVAYMVATDFGENEVLYAGIGIVFSSCLGFLALGISIGSLFQARRKRVLGIIGSITGAVLVSIFGLTWAIALVAIITLE